MLIRDFSQKLNAQFILSATEYNIDNCFMMLMSLLKDLASIDGIVFYSVHMLPEDDKCRYLLYNTILDKNKELYFCLENLSILNNDDINLIEDIMLTKKILKEQRLNEHLTL